VNGYNLLRSLLSRNATLVRIDLDSNNIRTMGGTHLSDFLATNPPLQSLYLENNYLNDSDAVFIANSLKRNTNLANLFLGRNEITCIEGNALSNAIFDSGSLNSAADSNHICTIHDIGLDRNTNNISGSARRNRVKKIFSILSSRNTQGANVYHLNLELGDASLKIAPLVLDCLARSAASGGSSYRPVTLSILYEVLRSWKMPSLYETGCQRN